MKNYNSEFCVAVYNNFQKFGFFNCCLKISTNCLKSEEDLDLSLRSKFRSTKKLVVPGILRIEGVSLIQKILKKICFCGLIKKWIFSSEKIERIDFSYENRLIFKNQFFFFNGHH